MLSSKQRLTFGHVVDAVVRRLLRAYPVVNVCVPSERSV